MGKNQEDVERTELGDPSEEQETGEARTPGYSPPHVESWQGGSFLGEFARLLDRALDRRDRAGLAVAIIIAVVLVVVTIIVAMQFAW